MAKLPEGEIRWPKKVATAADAVRLIDAVGYCLKVSIKNLPLPSLYYAVARRDIRDGPGWDSFYEKIWHWKDDLPRRHRAFYARYFKGRGTFISRSSYCHISWQSKAPESRPGITDSSIRTGESAQMRG